MKRLALAFLVAVVATSCGRESGFKPEPIALANHPSVLRGTWGGVVKGAEILSQSLRLELNATYVSPNEYRVSGSGTLGADTLNVTGTVLGGSRFTYLKPQLSPLPEGANLLLQRSGKKDLTLTCYVMGGEAASPVWSWQCFEKDNQAVTTVLKKEVQ
ncbi:hypothetical protein [Deinococcus marmoris]|uniref:hypothetical protein n=1 Tax=Deinococcus marmoris TaxID=249408 RepID=UPI000497B803|nr:hypothetical protein [Deinococcus marmoris]